MFERITVQEQSPQHRRHVAHVHVPLQEMQQAFARVLDRCFIEGGVHEEDGLGGELRDDGRVE